MVAIRTLILLFLLGVAAADAGEPMMADAASDRLISSEPAFTLRYDGMILLRARRFAPRQDPGKIRYEVQLAVGTGQLYLMVWDLTRLDVAEWYRRAVGPALFPGASPPKTAWLPGADEVHVVDHPGERGGRGQRVYGIRAGSLGFSLVCWGTDDPAVLEACDRLAGSLEVVQ